MSCTRYRESIQELVDGTLGPIRAAELQRHLDDCAECRAWRADLQVIHDTAASLEELAPPDGVWLQVAGRLRQEGRVNAPAPVAGGERPRHRNAAVLAFAAALLLAVGASMMVLMGGLSGPADPLPGAVAADNPAAGDAVQTIADEIRLAEQHYQKAIAGLERVARLDTSGGDATIDAQTAATLQKSLGVIDQAIEESRAALRTEPQSAPARDSLFDALKRKVVLLQDTVALMNEMRKGNAAGAAQIVDGLNKS